MKMKIHLKKVTVLTKQADLPDTEYVFKFKELNEEPFKLQLPKDVTVKNVKDKISERNSVDSEDITMLETIDYLTLMF